MCHLFDDNKTESVFYNKADFRVLKIYLYEVYLKDSKVNHSKDLCRRLVQCSICGSLFIQQITDNEIRYIEVKDEKEADKLVKKLPDNIFVSNKHNIVVVERLDDIENVTYLRKDR